HERGRPGRPVDIYHSTDRAEALFARSSADLTVELLSHIEEEDPGLVVRVFERRRRRRVEQARDQLSAMGFDEKVAAVAKILDGEGYLVDFEPLAGQTYRMTLHSCAIWAVASKYAEACTTELEFLREVLPEAEIERCAHKVAGAYVCGYEVRPRAPERHLARVPVMLPDLMTAGSSLDWRIGSRSALVSSPEQAPVAGAE
ncbi:MAG: helix-turn-helix transcriptional regulator, partial [Acidimicrobiia bacterium]